MQTTADNNKNKVKLKFIKKIEKMFTFLNKTEQFVTENYMIIILIPNGLLSLSEH